MPVHRFTFYLPSLSRDATAFDLTGDEHHHLARVLRLSAGETISVTDGRGLLVEAAIATTSKNRSTARVIRVLDDRAPARRVVLAMSLLPRAHFEVAVSQCVEVGVTDLIPVVAEKCHATKWSKAAAARVERVAIAAMKQSGRAWLPPVHEVRTLGALASEVASGGYGRAVVGDAGAPALTAVSRDRDVLAIVGPEAGLTDAEVARLVHAGAERASVSAHRLRAETAAVVLVAALARGADGGV
ncbi:MAG TPA: RsmE family RNA methyltransferase [Candidatus Krumholzibacteria bacterium]|nr:RsmE family RNA methyltransferase [Candidatus Krumholzibacteria bacterium]